jgi:hypothetical protein
MLDPQARHCTRFHSKGKTELASTDSVTTCSIAPAERLTRAQCAEEDQQAMNKRKTTRRRAGRKGGRGRKGRVSDEPAASEVDQREATRETTARELNSRRHG